MFSSIVALPILTGLAQTPDPYLLPIGMSGKVSIGKDELIRTIDGKKATVADVVRAADGLRFVFVGESHTNHSHHRLQAEIIEALAKAGRRVVVGFEMFTRPSQRNLDPWTMGWWTDEQFIENSGWNVDWKMDFKLYKPIFDVTKAHRIPMCALNVPRDWVRTVSRGGLGALTNEQKAAVPPVDLGNKEHRQVFDAMMGGHPPSGTQGENIYASMALWDTAMADSALRYLDDMPGGKKAVMVIVCGAGHGMYGQGITWRVQRRTGEKSVTVIGIEGSERREVSRGLSDFVFMSPGSDSGNGGTSQPRS